MEDKLIDLLADLFKIAPVSITDDLAMKDTDVWDSLKHMELVVGLEASFEIELSTDEIIAMQSVAEIKKILTTRGVVI